MILAMSARSAEPGISSSTALLPHAMSNRCGDFQSILGITIKDDEPWSGFKRKCFSQLLDDPQACRMLCDIEVQDPPTIMTDDEKAIERAEGDRRNSKEVHRGQSLPGDYGER